MGVKMVCPKCKNKQYCPCDSCNNTGKITWKWLSGNGPIECGHCGYVMSAEVWELEEYKQFKADGGNNE